MILFLSDLHIDPFRPQEKRQQLLIDFLKSVSKVDKIFLVGDVFDFWFEYDNIIPEGYAKIIETFSFLINKGIEINFIKGNHDQWAGQILSNIGFNIYEKEISFNYLGNKIHVAHGDFIDKTFSNRFTKFFLQSNICGKLFAQIPYQIGFPLASRMAQKNRNFKLNTSLIKAFENYALEKIEQRYSMVILGHLHHPVLKRIKDGIYVNLGDWIKHMSYLRIEKNVISLKNLLDENLTQCKIIRLSERR